jgi:preprotein translocase subunit SecG
MLTALVVILVAVVALVLLQRLELRSVFSRRDRRNLP